MPGVCAYPKTIEEVAAHHGQLRPPWSWEHNNKRHLIRIVPPVPGVWTCFTHTSCVCNEIISASNRVLGRVPLPTPDGLSELSRSIDSLARPIGHLEPWTLERVRDSFTGARKRRYEMAYESLRISPLWRADARINSFVKAEKYNPEDKVNPDPRMIQARDARYNLVIAKYLRPIEHYIYNLVAPSGLRVVAKGLNQRDRAELLISKFARFSDPVCFSVDASRWDKHISLGVLRLEHRFYQHIVPHCPEFDRLLKWQQNNNCRTAGGCKYVCHGGRMSGDINTALGNCLLMVAMMRAALKSLGVRDYEIMDDGDDCLVIINRPDFVQIGKLPEKFLAYGQELRIEGVTSVLSEVTFCQARAVWNGDSFIMVRNWRKVLSQSCCGTKHWNDPSLVRPMFGLVGSCELALCHGVPILQAFALALVRMSRGKVASLENMEPGYIHRLRAEYGSVQSAMHAAKASPVSDRARLSFEEAWGVPSWEQIAIENILGSWDVDTTIADTVPSEWDYTWSDGRQLRVMPPELH